MPHSPIDQPLDWIYLCTPQHTGTHFVRFLLELHPHVSFWKCGRTMVGQQNMADWQLLCQLGHTTPEKFSALVEHAPSDFPEWTRSEAKRLGIQIPEKLRTRSLFHSHLNGHKRFWYAGVPTIVTIRDPLLSVISALRRGSVEGANGVIGGFRFLNRLSADACFWFLTDLWAGDREKAFGVLDFLGLERTGEIDQFVRQWPALNSTSDGRFAQTDRPDLAEARRWALEERRIHPAVEWWAHQIQDAGLQLLFQRLGYRDLAWFI